MARSGTPTKPRTAQAKAVKPIRTLKKTKSHRVRNIICGFLAGILSLAALLGTVSHILPAGALVCDSCGDCADLRYCFETKNVGIVGDCGDRVASMVAVSVFLQ